MSTFFPLAVLWTALLVYALSAGADFGVGVLELFGRAEERAKLRRIGERAIAPVWEANHVWIILALVVLFVAYPEVHVTLTTALHVPLLLMLVGIVLRGTAFTFRYYDVDPSPGTERLWGWLFRGGSVLVPLSFGHLAAAAYRGRILQSPTTVWETYFGPWIGAFPLAAGCFTLSLFAWVAALFLLGELPRPERAHWRARVRRWQVATIGCGGVATLAAWWEGVPALSTGWADPPRIVAVLLATLAMGLLFGELPSRRIWAGRTLAGVVVLCVLGGYVAAAYPSALTFADAPPLTWVAAQAPDETLAALNIALVAGMMVIFPGLGWLMWIFKRTD